jgi:hypothetical protein
MRIVLSCLVVASIISCVKPPDYSDTPTLEFRNFSKSTLNQGVFGEDSITLVLYFTDGNGDFGTPGQGVEKNIFITDNRTKQVFREYKAPFVPVVGSGNGISGTISIKIYSTCCIFPESSGIFPCEKSLDFPENDLSLDVYIKDRAGNNSNIITTSTIKLLCN